MKGVEIEAPPSGCETYHTTLLTNDAVAFMAKLVRRFDNQTEQLYLRRRRRKLDLESQDVLPDFLPETSAIRLDPDWKVSPPPSRLNCRHVELGDVSPSNRDHFLSALKSSAHSVQVDFDDGHCPAWSNQLRGLYNVYAAVHGKLEGIGDVCSLPVLMLRPRAWNMPENNVMVDGKVVPGPLFDFGILMYHNAARLHKSESGPFFYLSKLEGYLEARLWNDVFCWSENELCLPRGSIRACVLIENILACFELEEILYELREHSAGLNCGIWDYSASFINKFGHRADFVLPDRNKYVNMERHFLKSYMDLVIQVCHKRGALATGGMAAPIVVTGDPQEIQAITDKVCSGKLKEIEAGVDGFLVYDVRLIEPARQLFQKHAPLPNQLLVLRDDVSVVTSDLLRMPSGGVTLSGLQHNIAVGIFFILAWFKGRGHYFYKGAVEDSATAEISRSQVWQWIRHKTTLEDSDGQPVTRCLVKQLIAELVNLELNSPTKTLLFEASGNDGEDEKYERQLMAASEMFEDIVTKKEFPEFITTFLYSDHTFLSQFK